MDTVNRIKKLGKLTMRLTNFNCIKSFILHPFFLRLIFFLKQWLQ